MNVLHIHSDYPDGRNDLSTPAVKSLLDATSGIVNTVFVIHRTPWPWLVRVIPHNPKLYSIYYWGLPFGFALTLSLFLARHLLFNLIQTQQINCQLIHGHKLAIDGTLGAAIANQMGIPYFLSIRGGTDVRILQHKALLRSRWKKVLEEAEHIFWVSCWAKKPINEMLKTTINTSTAQSSLLPNPCEMRPIENMSPVNDAANFVTVFRFEQYERKGIMPLLEAISKLSVIYQNIRLDIYGSGPASKIKTVQDKIDALSLNGKVTIKGRIDNTLLQHKLKQYSAFLLPSNNESFGMVFVEALFSGLPILYHANTGIDGYLDDIDVGIKVNNQGVDELANKVEELIVRHDFFQQRIKCALETHALDIFEKKTVVNHYQCLVDGLDLEYSHVE
ncbi:glycosyltransferase [Moritella sp.]|uniref:glycosyltransferase n=1 Tax=Moritella sp. TaxID=78556 RepID=UPI001D2CCBE7|nr:glycosyltransferase [Moritella sp.]MCJ8352080.1 glycosyltransferase [Moritella sp.]NQZ42187.1 glycosyltransferase [Moritella sp.]